MPKCIVILLDGTWNDSEADGNDTNIVRIRELISESLDPISPTAAGTRRTFTYADRNGAPQSIETSVYYDRGVGTGGLLDRPLGGAFGVGLERNVRRAYRYLAHNYEPGDHVFVLGFSRGAYTARSLVGLIAVAGLLKRENSSRINESKVWHYYRANRSDHFSSVSSELAHLIHEPDATRIEGIAVFDTVGALGIPIRRAWRENRDLFEFHDVDLSGISKLNLQALAIDEHRLTFSAAVWRAPKFSVINSITEQVWFSGSHSDIGGGNHNTLEWAANAPVRNPDDITLDWMIKRLKHHCRYFPITVGKRFAPIPSGGVRIHSISESRSRIYKLWRIAWRSIANTSYRFPRFSRQIYVGQDRHAKTIQEMVHISALVTWGDTNLRAGKQYCPRNLKLALILTDHTYRGRTSQKLVTQDPVRIVDWDGHPLDPHEISHLAKARRLLDRIFAVGPFSPVK
ncbi:DUF2235 domain-containing protein [Tardiphaga sp. 619_E2_N8_5]|jgi:hypothetical protein|uniref:DUF2235 domain-containing protein n=1 Tax=unclassified Tardiphaga TaxID=2631404 RepID=UPI003F22BBE8